MTLEFDPVAKKLSKVSMDSFLDEEKDEVTLDVGFQSLPDGTNYVANTLLRAVCQTDRGEDTESQLQESR
jgi:hypothetical protein